MSFSKLNDMDKENGNYYPSSYYDQSEQQQMNYLQEQSKMSEENQSVIKKLLYNDYNFNAQVSEYQKKILLYENSRLTMKAASQLLSNEVSMPQECQSSSKAIQKKNGKSMSIASFPQQNQKFQQQRQNDEEEQQEQQKNIWDELYEKGLKKKVMIELQMKQGEQEKIENQIQDLTFHPKLVADSSIYNINQPFQERNNNWQDAKNKRLAEIKKYYAESEDYKEVKECTFQPQILNKSRQIIQGKPKKLNENYQIKSQQQQQSKNINSYKQNAMKKQEFLKQKDFLHKQLQDLDIDL